MRREGGRSSFRLISGKEEVSVAVMSEKRLAIFRFVKGEKRLLDSE